MHSFKIGPAWDSRLEPGRVEKKTEKEKTWCDPATRLTQKNPVKNSVATR
jgi:hypothetical protein